jgi:hypothetical protein
MPAGFTEARMSAGVLPPLVGVILSHGSVSKAVNEVDPPVLEIASVRDEGVLPPI